MVTQGRYGALACILLLVLPVACGGAALQPWSAPSNRDRGDDPAKVRPGYCSSELPLWWPLAAPEVDALSRLEEARNGDPHALFALALLASADGRKRTAYQALDTRLDEFIESVRPKVEGANDEWHRGYELHRAMHRVLFHSKSSGLNNYELEQSRVTGIFDNGKYNCISSAMLFTVLARAFDMPVRGVSVPTHAFVELGPPDGKILEVETTTDTGFDHVHDARFYRESAEEWSSSRGLAPVTFEQYQKRQILEPFQLMALGMLNQSIKAKGAEHSRLLEIAAFVDPKSRDAHLARVGAYLDEANELRDTESMRTMAKLFDCVEPSLSETEASWARDAEIMNFVSWARYYHEDALMVVGRDKEATAMADQSLSKIQDSWEDAAHLRDNHLQILMDQMLVLMDQKKYEAAAAVMQPRLETCRTAPACTNNLEIVYLNWSAEYQNRGDWHVARDALRECVGALPKSGNCKDGLADLESRHRF